MPGSGTEESLGLFLFSLLPRLLHFKAYSLLVETDDHHQHLVFIIYLNLQKGLSQTLVELHVYLQTCHCVKTQEWGQVPHSLGFTG